MSGLTHVQLHGDEDNYQIRRLNIPSIKSLGVTSESDMKNAQGYEADYILFDSPKEKFHGGNGKTFSWELLRDMPKELRKKMILAGGLNALNIEEAIRTVRPYMVDVSNGVETEGKKDVENKTIYYKSEGVFQMNYAYPDEKGHYGIYGGRYVPETLMQSVLELEEAYKEAMQDEAFQKELNHYLKRTSEEKHRYIMLKI